MPLVKYAMFSADNVCKIGLNTAPTTEPPLIPKNQKICKKIYAVTIAPNVSPKLRSGVCKNVKIIVNASVPKKPSNKLIKKKNVITSVAGIKAEKD